MAEVTRKIGLSLGADICWPFCYEEIVRELDLAIPLDGDRVRFEVERISIEPFNLRQPCKYDVVIDRLTHWLDTSREWIKKSIIMDGLYVFNNPWSVQSMQKCTTYCAMMHLGLPIPETWLVPPKAYEPSDDLDTTLQSYAKLFSLEDLGGKLADAHFDTTRFHDFCETHLAHLDEVAWEFFGSPAAKDAVRLKVEALFPEHEVEEFTEHFWGLLQFWRKTDQDRRHSGEA